MTVPSTAVAPAVLLATDKIREHHIYVSRERIMQSSVSIGLELLPERGLFEKGEEKMSLIVTFS